MNERLKKQIKNFWNDKDKKSWHIIIYESLYLFIKNKSFPLHYFTRYVYRKDSGNFLDYIDIGLAKKIWNNKNIHNIDCCNTLRDKFLFYKFCVSNNINTIPIVLMSKRGVFYNEEEQKQEIDGLKEFITYIKGLDTNLFIKPTNGIQGKNCFKLLKNNLNDIDYLNHIFEISKTDDYIFQELISQHEIVNQIYNGSINTIRIDSYRDNLDKKYILTAFMRFGSNGNYTDNTSTGGFIVPIDLESGTFKGDGIQYLSVGTEPVESHPNTHIKFKGTKVPDIEQVKSLVIQLSSKFSDKLVGWDIALTDKGPVVVEGNCDYALAGQDIINKGYKQHIVFNKMLKESGLL